jgi:hypothetical protein
MVKGEKIFSAKIRWFFTISQRRDGVLVFNREIPAEEATSGGLRYGLYQ